MIDTKGYRSSKSMNQSQLKKILISVWEFENFSYEEKEPWKEGHFNFGDFFEEFLGTGEVNEDRYIVSDEDASSYTDTVVSIVDAYIDLEGSIHDDGKRVEKAMEGFYKNIKDPLKRMLKWENECKGFLEYRKDHDGKAVLSSDQLASAITQRNYILNDPELSSMVISPAMESEIIDKYVIDINGFKGEIDKLFIDHQNKSISIIDVKTCPDASKDFLRNFYRHRYDFQGSFYSRLLREYLPNSIWRDYSIDQYVHFLVASSKKEHPPCVYKMHEYLGLYNRQGSTDMIYGVDEAISRYYSYSENRAKKVRIPIIERKTILEYENSTVLSGTASLDMSTINLTGASGTTTQLTGVSAI